MKCLVFNRDLESVIKSCELNWIYLEYINTDSERHLWKTCCSVLCPSLDDPSPKLHRKPTSVPTLIRQLTVAIWFCGTDGWWIRRLSSTALWTTSGNTSEVREVRPLDMTATTSYLQWGEGERYNSYCLHVFFYQYKQHKGFLIWFFFFLDLRIYYWNSTHTALCLHALVYV